MNRFWLDFGKETGEKGRKLLFDQFMFRDHRPRPFSIFKHENMFFRKKTIEHAPIKESIEGKSKEEIQLPQNKKSKKRSLKSYDTISGNYILTRCWDGNNMWVFKIRRRKR